MNKITFVTGKGGVGKSALAASLALSKAQKGLKVLLVELGDQSFYKDFFNLPKVEYKPTKLQENLDISLWSGPACLEEYAKYLLKIERLYQLFFENPVMRTFINIAPALPELAIVGKITSGHRKVGPPLTYDEIIIDTYATGHFLALLRAPKGMAEVVKFGPMGEQTRSIQKVLFDPEITSIEIVTLPEGLPTTESLELAHKLESEFNFKPRIWVNKCLTTGLSAQDFKVSSTSESPAISKMAEFLQKKSVKENHARESFSGFKTFELPLVEDVQAWKLIEELSANCAHISKSEG
jgi:anion-transporting  ArsA/GET3 family ATPase